ncbi:hypothetical protein [Polaribacter sp.]|uniref:hypothetical protein n=1 Tax=Polaribacter sp. TaxID=1920175 RepID=UPI0025CE22CB|nr:hypothetical protein [Polaribacter sp.]
MKRLFEKHIKNNLGLINLFGKISGRFLFLLLTSFFAYKLSFKDFATFAIFWTALRMLTFFSANNLYIIYFNEVRESVINDKKWPIHITSNIILTLIVFGSLSTIISSLIFNNLIITALMIPSLLFFVIIRNISEFSKSDNSVYLSIFIEDFLFYFLFFITGVISVYLYNSLIGILIALFFTTFITAIISLVLFNRKFKLKTNTYRLKVKDFSFKILRLGINYTFLRGNEFLSSFGVRYFGQIYFGDIFVSYTHIMYQFYNVFTLITISVISGMQSKITVKKDITFNKYFVKNMYFKILKTISPFVFGAIIIIFFFNSEILNLFFPKYIQYNELLVKVSLTGLVFMVIQPLIFILIYNNKVYNIRLLNFVQYLGVIIVYIVPVVFLDFNEEYWLLILMTIFIIIQGVFSLLSYKKIK